MRLVALVLTGLLAWAAVAEAKPRPARKDLADVIGLDTKTGEVHNETEPAYSFELSSSVVLLSRGNQLKLAISPTMARRGDWKLALDLGDDLVGVSLVRDVIPVIRAGLGVGVARDLHTGEWTPTIKGCFRTW